nr:MAG TPA: hypothetical protein [Caudoviricetes sp.]
MRLDYKNATHQFESVPNDVVDTLCVAIDTEYKKRSKEQHVVMIHLEAALETMERFRKRMYVPNSIESVEIVDAEENGD